MEFQAYIIKQNNSAGIKVCYVGICIFMLSICMFYLNFADVAPLAISIGFIVFIVGLVMARGNLSSYIITEDILSVTTESISVGSNIYPLLQLSNIHFHYDSFNSQSSFGYYTENSGKIRYGIGNFVRFTYVNQELSTTFALADEIHANNFLSMLYEMRSAQISFTAGGRYFPTFE